MQATVVSPIPFFLNVTLFYLPPPIVLPIYCPADGKIMYRYIFECLFARTFKTVITQISTFRGNFVKSYFLLSFKLTF